MVAFCDFGNDSCFYCVFGWLLTDKRVAVSAFLLSLFGGIVITIAAFGFDVLSLLKVGNVDFDDDKDIPLFD